MPDPFSIGLGVVALLQLTYSAGNSLRKFVNDAGIVDATLQNLQDEIDGLARVLESMRVTFEKVEVEEGTGHVAAHWRNVAQSIEDGKGILQQLEEQITNIGQNSKFLDSARKQYRLNSHKNKIAAFRMHVQSYRDGLQLSLQTIILWNQVSQQDAANQVLPALSDLQKDIRRIALDMNQRIETLQALVVSKQDQDQVNAMQHLHDCVRSAASVVSSASTKMPTVAEDDSENVVLFSDFGDCFPVEQTFAMRRWMQAQTVTAYDDAEPQAVPASIGEVESDRETPEASDPEADLEDDLISALLERGKQHMRDGDYHYAGRSFRNCLSRLSNLQAVNRTNKRTTSSYLDVLEHLLKIHRTFSQWPEAQEILQRRLASRKHVVGNEDAEYLADVLLLAQVTNAAGKLAESQLHARRALSGYRRLQDRQQEKACLKLLIEQARTEGNEYDVEGYTVLLEAANIQDVPETTDMPSTYPLAEANPTQNLDEDAALRNDLSVQNLERDKVTQDVEHVNAAIARIQSSSAEESAARPEMAIQDSPFMQLRTDPKTVSAERSLTPGDDATPPAQHSSLGSQQNLSSPPPAGGGQESSMGYGTDEGNETDISAFGANRRRRRAEWARRMEAAKSDSGEYAIIHPGLEKWLVFKTDSPTMPAREPLHGSARSLTASSSAAFTTNDTGESGTQSTFAQAHDDKQYLTESPPAMYKDRETNVEDRRPEREERVARGFLKPMQKDISIRDVNRSLPAEITNDESARRQRREERRRIRLATPAPEVNSSTQMNRSLPAEITDDEVKRRRKKQSILNAEAERRRIPEEERRRILKKERRRTSDEERRINAEEENLWLIEGANVRNVKELRALTRSPR